MNIIKRSNITFFLLLIVLTLAAALNTILPQGNIPGSLPSGQGPHIPAWQLMLGSAGLVLVMYGLLGFFGLSLWRKLGFIEIWTQAVNNRQRFIIPAFTGVGIGVVMIIIDLVFSRFNGVGRIIHPPFPTSLVAAVAAGIGEEMIFRLFFISLWTWLVGKLILKGHGLDVVFWIVAIFSAFAHAASHLPAFMIIWGVTNPMQLSPALLLEVLLMNGLISIVGAYYFKKFGLLATMGVHFWADIIWHMVWGLL
jgi:hypothetical protein